MSGVLSSLIRYVRLDWFTGRLALVAALALLFAPTVPMEARAAAHTETLISGSMATDEDGNPLITIQPGERMLVESDQLVYDYDSNKVSAIGHVIIYYGGYTLEADEVTYDQDNGRLIAIGNVKMVDPTGATIRSEYFDVTDDFADGFVRSLQVDTAQRTHFEAASAERSAKQTVFHDSAYSACPSCVNNPDKPPFWKIKAKKIIIDHEERVVRFTNASFEFFGTPIAWFPYFAIADPTVSRKTGLLSPRIDASAKLGIGAGIPYFLALAPHYDLTLTPTY
ncbi:MAG: LPS-assembly protein LptD, partial [Alphaproteobacteria bacterium]